MTREEAIKTIRLTCPKISDSECDFETAMRFLIPELAESEDERIRKSIIQTLEFACAHKLVDYDAVVKMKAYLEKQKEEEGYEAIPVESTLEYKLGFKAGKESEKQKESLHISETCKENADSFTDEDERIRRKMIEHFKSKTKDTWCNIPVKSIISYLEKQKEQKPVDDKAFEEWLDDWYQGSKEAGGDVVMSESEFKNWSRGIRNMYEQKPVEWSDKDEEMRNIIIAIFEVNHPNGFFKANELGTTDMRGVHTEEIISWLKSLRPSWKPSKEQLLQLRRAISGCSYDIEPLVSLEEQLKQL